MLIGYTYTNTTVVDAGVTEVWQLKEWIQVTGFNTKQEGVDVLCSYASLIRFVQWAYAML